MSLEHKNTHKKNSNIQTDQIVLVFIRHKRKRRENFNHGCVHSKKGSVGKVVGLVLVLLVHSYKSTRYHYFRLYFSLDIHMILTFNSETNLIMPR